MNPQACSQSPELLVEQIERFVQARTSGTIRGLRVDVVAGEVIISGRASSYYTKQLATHAAMHAVEDLSLSNQIEVC